MLNYLKVSFFIIIICVFTCNLSLASLQNLAVSKFSLVFLSVLWYSLTYKGLILALEPEAAALCCRKNRTQLTFKPGTKYLVLDCGGGTVDIAVHEIDESGMTLSSPLFLCYFLFLGHTHSLAAPIGGPWGSTVIDENFKKLLCEVSLIITANSNFSDIH